MEVDLVEFGLSYLGRIDPTAVVLDAGCGAGRGSLLLRERFGCPVEGGTLSPEQARVATRFSLARGGW
jgi:geranyl diphosphate 2-C-methyltransferase